MAVSLLTSIQEQSEDEVRARLAKVSTPNLDRLRADIKMMPTSGLLMAFATGAHQFISEEEATRMNQQELELVIAACVVVLGDEIDRRIPIPK